MPHRTLVPFSECKSTHFFTSCQIFSEIFLSCKKSRLGNARSFALVLKWLRRTTADCFFSRFFSGADCKLRHFTPTRQIFSRKSFGIMLHNMLWRLKSGRRRLELGIAVRRRAEESSRRRRAGQRRGQRPAEEDGRGRRRTAEEDGGTAWAVNEAEDGGGGRMAAEHRGRRPDGSVGSGGRREAEDGRYGERRTGRRQAAWAQTGNRSSYGVLLIINARVRAREGVCEKITDRGFRLGENECAQKKGGSFPSRRLPAHYKRFTTAIMIVAFVIIGLSYICIVGIRGGA